ncbi:MAG: hypothetical protein OXU75_17560 [Deltaproteobacteria bacterium]|nr:hypothetical protein [Deltaproteobacteria bacterium]
MIEDFETGIENCVARCARVERSQSVHIVTEEGAADTAVVEALTESVRGLGGDVHVVNGPVIPKDRPQEIPPSVLDAYRRADVLFAHYPSLKREALHPHFPGESRVRVPNRARTVSLMSSEWAGFPYSVQRALATTLDTLSAPGKAWRVTSPNGTDVRGTFGSRESTVAQAYFVEDEGGRARRNFPGGVHSPVVAVATEGMIVADHIAGFGGMPDRLRLELKGGRVVSIEGGDPEGPMHEALGGTDGFIDSWHAGVNPKTIVPVARADNPVQWYSYSHCSPMIVHFHVGRSHAPVDVACFDQTIEIDGRTVYEEGGLTIWDEPDVDSAVNASGMADSMMVNTPMTRN